jgi:hypothetical protein
MAGEIAEVAFLLNDRVLVLVMIPSICILIESIGSFID